MKSISIRVFISLGVVFLLSVPGPTHAGDWEGNANFLLGQKWLSNDDWGRFDSQDEFAAMISFGRSDWPVQVAIDLVTTWEDGEWWDYIPEASTVELDLGVRKVWERGKARPFFGGGLALIHGDIETFDLDGWYSRDDASAGVWIDGGVFWRIRNHLNLGFEARLSTADITIDGVDRDGGGTHLGFLIGYGW